MESIRTVLERHGTLLVLDAASQRGFVGVLVREKKSHWAEVTEDAANQIFPAAEKVLNAAGVNAGDVGAFVLCDGPGAQLGIRAVAMAVRVWRGLMREPCALYGYRSLQLVAALQVRRVGAVTGFSVICDARREAWHRVDVDVRGSFSEVRRVSSAELGAADGVFFEPEGFLRWAEAPKSVAKIAYEPQAFSGELFEQELLFPLADAEPWQSMAVEYKTWSGERHRGAGF